MLSIPSAYGMVPNCGTIVTSENEQASCAAFSFSKITSGVPISRFDAWYPGIFFVPGSGLPPWTASASTAVALASLAAYAS